MQHPLSDQSENNNSLQQQIANLHARNAELEALYKNSQKALKAAQAKNARLEEHAHNLEESLNLIINSNGHRLLDKYYTLIHKIKDFIQTLKTGLWNIKNAPSRLVQALKRRKAKILTNDECYAMLKKCKRIDIMAVKHTAYVAKLLQGILQNAGIQSNILMEEPDTYEKIPYIIICPQNFKHFPSLYVAFQMEQTVSQRWLTDEYINILRNAYAVFDYSLENINYFSKDPQIAKKLFYMPIDVCSELLKENSAPTEKKYDVLFYGAMGNERRKAYLDRIDEKYNIKIISDSFGNELYTEMKNAKIIVNIHYYENALLETTRLYETLSVCDSLIISERSSDPNEEARLEEIVDFVEVGNIDAMLERIDYWLTHEGERKVKTDKNRQLLITRSNATNFYLNRFLLANDRISFDEFYETCGNFVQFKSDRICLSLPETPERRASFVQDDPQGFEIFYGLKHYKGWIGCGLSYKFIFKKALEQQLDRILICEDDTYFPDNFTERFSTILQYLEQNNDWDVFSGIMSDFTNIKVLFCEDFSEETFVYVNRMISMVYNIYNQNVFPLIAQWDNTNWDISTNTIDRYLERENLQVLTTNPFLVGHKEDLDSIIWGSKNTRYADWIANSSKTLNEKTEEYKRIHNL